MSTDATKSENKHSSILQEESVNKENEGKVWYFYSVGGAPSRPERVKRWEKLNQNAWSTL